MATLGNERYMRHIWLLGEGGLLVLRGTVTRETAIHGQPLEIILASNKTSSLKNIMPAQKSVLFPTSSTVNQDVNTWDMSLLLLVIKNIFWSSLHPADQAPIETIKTYRNNIQGHPNSLLMERNDYDTNRGLVEYALRKLATSLGGNFIPEIEDIIQNSASSDIDIGSVLGRIKDLLEYDTTLKSLENKIDLANSTLSDMNNSLRDMTVCSERDFRETKDEQQRMLQIVSDMAQLNRRYILDQTRRQKSKDLETIVQANCSNKVKEKKAIELLYSVVEIIQGASTSSESEIKARITQMIQRHGELTPTLIEEVIGWFKDINDNPDTSVGTARLGSIRLPIKCSSVGGLLRHFDYMNGGESQRRLLDMSTKLSQQLGFSCNLSWSVVPESVVDVTQALYKLTEPSKLVLPFKTTSVKGLQNIWKMFDGEEKKTHLLNISQTLSKMFEENIQLTAAVKKDQFQTALLEIGMPRYRSEQKLKKSCGVQTELEIDATTSEYTPMVQEIGIQTETFDKTLKYLPVIPRRNFPGYRQLMNDEEDTKPEIPISTLGRSSEGKTIGRCEETDDDDELPRGKSIWSPRLYVTCPKIKDNPPSRSPDLLRHSVPISESLWRPFLQRTKIETQPKIKDNPPSRSPDEPTWNPKVNLFTDYEKEAPKEEIEDKTHIPIPGHKET